MRTALDFPSWELIGLRHNIRHDAWFSKSFDGTDIAQAICSVVTTRAITIKEHIEKVLDKTIADQCEGTAQKIQQKRRVEQMVV